MPLISTNSVGATTIANGMVNFYDEISTTPEPAIPRTLIFGILATDQLPHLTFYCQQLSGNAAVTIQPEFSIRKTDAGNFQQFDPLSAPQVVPASGILVLNFDVPANFIRMRVNIGADPAQVVVRTILQLQANSF